MFKKSAKTKSPAESIKLTEVPDREPNNQPALPEEAGATSAYASKPVNAGRQVAEIPTALPSAGAAKGPPASGSRLQVRVEKPSKALIWVITLIMLILFTGWSWFFGPVLPFAAKIERIRGNYQSALTMLDSGLAVNPLNPELLKDRAIINLALGQINQAKIDVNKILALHKVGNQTRAEALAMRGDISMQQGRMQEADQDFAEAGRLDKSAATMFHQKAFYCLNAGYNPAEAARLECIALSIDPNLPKSYINLSLADYYLGLYQKSIADAGKGLDLKINWDDWRKYPQQARVDLLSNRALARYGMHDLAGCIADAKAACDLSTKLLLEQKLNPLPYSYRNLAAGYIDNGQFQEALDLVNALPENLKRDHVLLAYRREAMGNLKKHHAKGDPTMTRSERDDAFNDFYWDAKMYLDSKNWKSAEASATRALRLYHRSAPALRLRAQAYKHLGLYAQAIADLKAALGGFYLDAKDRSQVEDDLKGLQLLLDRAGGKPGLPAAAPQ